MTQSGTAIVTGASRGIGAAIARRLAADGFAVVVNYAHSTDEADRVVAAIAQAGGRAVAAQGDVGDPATIGLLFDEAARAFGAATVLVNNAGIMALSPIVETDDAAFDRHLRINLAGSFYGMREGARRLPEGGRLINFSSSVVGAWPPNYGAYAATKAAVEAMTHILAKELGPRRVTVNAVAPGPTATDLFLDGKPQSVVDAIVKEIPLGRLGTPEEIAGVVAFLAGPDGGWVNGQVIRANGGRN